MKIEKRSFSEQEFQAIAKQKPLLPFHLGEVRFQTTLDQDLRYREMVFASMAVALIAGSGFGQLSSVTGPIMGALFCIAAATIAVRAVACRFHSQKREAGISGNSNTLLVAGSICVFGIFGTIMSGTDGLISLVLVLVALGFCLFAMERPGTRQVLSTILLLALGGFTAWKVGTSSLLLAPGLLIGVALSGIAVFNSRSVGFELQPVALMSSASLSAWVVMAVTTDHAFRWGPILILTGYSLLAVLERTVSRRSSFAPIVVAVILIHLSGSLVSDGRMLQPVAPQVIAVILELGILGMAGYRHALARLTGFPQSTYRSSPQCLVAAIDHAWEHSVKIDAF